MQAVVVMLVMGCGPEPAPLPPPGPTSAPVATASVSTEPEPAAPSGVIGAACTTEVPFQRGSCAEGSMCAPGPGGYCLAWCGYGDRCPDGAVCAESHRGGQLCMARCQGDGDCREGYRCDPAWKVCGLPGSIAPKPPVCPAASDKDGAPVPRRAFGEAKMISTGPERGRYSFEPTAALLRNGDLAVVYTAMNKMQEDNALQAVVVRAGGEVTAPTTIKSSRKRHFDPWLAPHDGGLALVWLGHDGGGRDLNAEIGLSRSKDGLTWSPPRAIHDQKTDCTKGEPFCLDKPMVAAQRSTPRPGLIAMYAGAEQRVIVSDAKGESFSNALTVGIGAYGDIYVDLRGAVHAVASTTEKDAEANPFGDPNNFVGYIRSDDGGNTFSAPVRVTGEDEPVPFYFSNPQVAHHVARRQLHVAYPTGGPDTQWNLVLATSTDGGKTWTKTRVNDDADCANHMTPKMVLDERTGEVHLVWKENRGGVGRLVYARCTADGKRCSPNEAVSTQPFAAYGYVRHATMWLGEYDALVLDDARRVLHAVWTQPVEEDGVPTSRVFYAQAKL